MNYLSIWPLFFEIHSLRRREKRCRMCIRLFVYFNAVIWFIHGWAEIECMVVHDIRYSAQLAPKPVHTRLDPKSLLS